MIYSKNNHFVRSNFSLVRSSFSNVVLRQFFLCNLVDVELSKMDRTQDLQKNDKKVLPVYIYI
jgi:hypothetical protein